MGVMDKNLDVITYAVSLIAKAVIMASGFSGRVDFYPIHPHPSALGLTKVYSIPTPRAMINPK